MFGSNQFTFETPNVIDMGDVQPPTPPSRSSTSLRGATTRPTSTSPAEETTSTSSTSVSSTPNSVASSRKNSNDTDDMTMDHHHDHHLANSTNEHDDIALARVNATRLLNDIRDLELQHQHQPYPTAVSSPIVPEQHQMAKPLSQRLPFRDFPTYVVQSDGEINNSNTDHHHHHSLPNSAHDAYIHAASTSNKKSIGRTMKLSAPRIVGTTSKKSLFSRSKGVIDDDNDDKQSLYETDKDTIFSSNINKLRAWMEEIWFYMKLYRRTISIIVIIVLIVVLSTTLTRTKTQVSYGGNGKGSTMPNFAGTDRYDQIVTYISETKHITTKEDLLAHDGKTSKTPQNAALNWIAGIDEMQISIDHPQFLQRYILAVMYFATGGTISSTRLYDRALQGTDEDGSKTGAGWVQPLHFLSNTNECTWSNVIAVPSYTNERLNMGVSCNDKNDVTSIFIPNNGLHGSIPSEVGYLSHLTLFGVQNNDHIIGTIPKTFGSLTNLLYVNFNQNQLSGTIPDFVGNWNDCEVLGLESNNMTGTIPASLGTMSRLLTIALSNNNFTGSLELIRHLPSIEYFYVANNQFTGEIEEEFFYNMQHIRELDLSHNEFHGNFPFRMLFKGENLHTIDIAHNHFMGTFPHVISTPNYVLHYLNIRNNRISGSIPNSINMITQLQHFDITNNVMTGTLPNSIGKCTELEHLFLGNNTLSMVDSSDGTRLLPPLSELDLLRELSLTGLGIPGTIPPWLRLLTDLEMLDLSHNEFSGTIPHKIWSLPKLYYLILNDNVNITGPLPTSGGEQLSLLSVHHTNIDDGNFDSVVCKDTNINAQNGGPGIVIIADCDSGCTDSCCSECCTPAVDGTNDTNDPCSNNSELVAKFTDGIDHVVTSFAFDPSVLAEADVFNEVDEMIENP